MMMNRQLSFSLKVDKNSHGFKSSIEVSLLAILTYKLEKNIVNLGKYSEA